MKLFKLMNENAEDLAKIIVRNNVCLTSSYRSQDILTSILSILGHPSQTAENGKPLADAKGETAYSASFIEWYVPSLLDFLSHHHNLIFQNVSPGSRPKR
jgi:acyl-CoA reductase-like NAD-dependent aldehyde dehydrogenase